MKTLRYILIPLCFLFVFFEGFSQAHSFTYFSAGITGSATHLQGLNDVIDRYNETRQGQEGAASLSKDMGHIMAQSGYEFALGRVLDDLGWFMDLHLSFFKAETYAEGFNLDGSPVRRDLKLESAMFSAGVGKSIIQNRFIEMGAGIAIDVNWNKVYTAVNAGDMEEIFEDESPVSIAPFTQATLFLSRKIPLAAFGRGFLEFPVLRSDYSDLNQALNPYTYLNDEGKDFKSLNWRPGFSVGLALILHERDLSFHR